MTDKEIGKIVREITDRGSAAIVKKNKDGIIIMEEKCKIVRSDKEQQKNCSFKMVQMHSQTMIQ